jgi:hypothetical protein
MTEDFEATWTHRAIAALRGARIIDVCYLSRQQTHDVLNWSLRPPVLLLDNGVALFPSTDTEGNDAGALRLTRHDLSVIPPLQLDRRR